MNLYIGSNNNIGHGMLIYLLLVEDVEPLIRV